MADMYGYFEPHTTWPRCLVVDVLDFGTRGPGSIHGWATIIHCFLFLLYFSVIMLKYSIQVICAI